MADIINNNGSTFTQYPILNFQLSAPLLSQQVVKIYRDSVLINTPAVSPGQSTITFVDSVTPGTYTYIAEVVNQHNQKKQTPPFTFTVMDRYYPEIIGVFEEESTSTLKCFCPSDDGSVRVFYPNDFGISCEISSTEATGAYTIEDDTGNVIFTVNHITGTRTIVQHLASENFTWFNTYYIDVNQEIILRDPSDVALSSTYSLTCL